MKLRNVMTFVCMALTIGVSTPVKAGDPHPMLDTQANALNAGILSQDVAAVVIKALDLAEFIKRNLSMGELQAFVSQLNLDNALGVAKKTAKDAAGKALSSIKKSAQNSGKNASDGKTADSKGSDEEGTAAVHGNISVPSELQKIGYESAMTDANKMSALVREELLPPVNESAEKPLTASEKADRQKKRQALMNAAVADAYGLSVAAQYEGTNVQESTIEPAKKRVGSAETIQEKNAAGLDVGLARLSQLVKANELSAMSLRLQAAEAIGNMPRDFE